MSDDYKGSDRKSGDELQTHFDLGIAYAEMGLLADAATELEIVLRSQPGNSVARSALETVRLRMGVPPESGPDGAA
jgi:hypothetical protein